MPTAADGDPAAAQQPRMYPAAAPAAASGSASAQPPGSPEPEQPAPEPPAPQVPGLSLIDLVLGAGSLTARVGMIPVRVAVRLARGPGDTDSSAETGDLIGAAGTVGNGDGADSDAPTAAARRPVRDWSTWAVRSVAQVGVVERRRAHDAAHTLVASATSAVANEPHLGRLVREIAGAQLEPLIDEALPIVLGKLADDPSAVRRIVQDQSAGIMSEATDSARNTARHGDEAVDTLVNRILHRTPHTETPAQPEPVP